MEDTQDENNVGPLDREEAALVIDFRRCSPRRKETVRRITRKLAGKAWAASGLKISTNIIQFRRRKDD